MVLEMNQVPELPIDYEQYSPNNISVWDNYIEINGERRKLERAIKSAKFPYLIESEKGQGKTLLVHTICKENNIALVEQPIGSGTRKEDLIGRKEINKDGSVFNLGLLPRAILTANYYKHACLYGDEGNTQDYEIQKWWNSICDGRKSIVANDKMYRLNEGCKLSIVWTINPAYYLGVNSMTHDLRSRFVGSVWKYPTSEDIERVINWEEISEDLVKKPILRLVQDIHSLVMKSEVEYSISIRDIAQFCDYYREYVEEDGSDTIENTLKETILVKYSDVQERELVRNRINDTFGVNIK